MTTMTVVKISNDGFNQPLKMFLKLHFTSFKVANRWRVNVLFVGVELIRRRMDEMQKLILLWARLDDVKIGPRIGRIDWSWVRIYREIVTLNFLVWFLYLFIIKVVKQECFIRLYYSVYNLKWKTLLSVWKNESKFNIKAPKL